MKRFFLLALLLAPVTTMAQTLEFKGYRCTKDCSGHRAGYDWAARKNIQNPEDCSGNSNSFVQGCRAYAKERAEEDEILSEDIDHQPKE